jgi:hypothetical protein
MLQNATLSLRLILQTGAPVETSAPMKPANYQPEKAETQR